MQQIGNFFAQGYLITLACILTFAATSTNGNSMDDQELFPPAIKVFPSSLGGNQILSAQLLSQINDENQ